MESSQFVGRKSELSALKEFSKRKTAGLAVVRGRRRIGKSSLVQQFAKGFKSFYEFYGLPPREKMTNLDQLNHFGELFGSMFNLPPQRFSGWTQAFESLAQVTQKQKAIIFLDEISWMGSKDKDFAGKLKGVWDTKFKQNNRLLLIICGSVTSWIDKNILEDKGFMGRVSLTITLEELPLCDANLFWKQAKHISAFEKFKILSVTGGVPRYLEEINPRKSAEENIKRTCFTKEGFLFSEFNQIFKDIFSHQSETYRKVAESLASGPLEPSAIAEKLGKLPSGGLSKILHVLEISGFIRRDFSWNPSGKNGVRSKYRIHDNYIRFWLKYIKPAREKIKKGLFSEITLENLKGWESIMGLQFEALILNNLPHILFKLRIPAETVENAGPYFQKETKRMKGCQIDLLISTRFSEYVCEIKYRKKIGLVVITEMEEKIQKLKVPKTKSIRPVLIYLGELSESVQKSDLFTHLISADEMLIKK